MAKQKRVVIGTGEIHRLLSNRYAAPAWALLHEVRNATGYQRTTRTADAIAMSLWPSRGLELHGFEVKVSRSDLRRELDDPEKAVEIQQYCDHWWLVIGHKDLIQPGELPKKWGLIVAQKNRLVAKVEAPQLESKPLDKGFVASILRNFTDSYVPRSMLKTLVDEKYKEWQQRDDGVREMAVSSAKREIGELNDIINKFEEASGVNIRNRWRVGKIGEAVKEVMNGDFGQSRRRLERLAIDAQSIADQAKRELETIERIEELRNDRSN